MNNENCITIKPTTHELAKIVFFTKDVAHYIWKFPDQETLLRFEKEADEKIHENENWKEYAVTIHLTMHISADKKRIPSHTQEKIDFDLDPKKRKPVSLDFDISPQSPSFEPNPT